VSKQNPETDASLAEIERTQKELRTSIEASKALAEKSERLIARHRQHIEGGIAGAPPSKA
jgi:hypothetical protein